MKASGLSAADICKIIDTCAKRGAKEFSLGDLKLVFGGEQDSLAGTSKHSATISASIHQEQQKVFAQELLKQEILTKEEELAQMLITDPARAEELYLAGELEGPGESGSGN